MKSLTGVGAILSAAHHSKDGVLHGHTWEIIAWWEAGEDALILQSRLNEYLSNFDHTLLGDDVAWGEAFGKSAVMGLGCVKVEVRRPLERIYAEVTQ